MRFLVAEDDRGLRELIRLRAKLVNSGLRIPTVRGAGFRLDEA